MKIYIETEMTEIPKGCGYCPNVEELHNNFYVCIKKYGDESVDWDTVNFDELECCRPNWCPLRTKQEIADKKENE